MARLILVVLLALPLRPAEAEAGTHAHPDGSPALHDARAWYGAEMLRSPGWLGLLQGITPQHLGGGTERSERGSGLPLELLRGSGPLALRARLLADPRSTLVDAGVSPLCENLPYFATAPPSSR